MTKVFLTLLIIINFSFSNKDVLSYANTKKNILKTKNTIRLKYLACENLKQKKLIIEDSRILFTNSLLNEIIPFWIGTKWTFEGHTEFPKQGSIACGYFVSTTLCHNGLKLNRYKLAQKSPENEAKTLQDKNLVTNLKSITITELENYFIKNKKDGLYFIGLDFHVGYILKEKNSIYFIHSNYINSTGVVKEKSSNSKALVSSNYFIADITYNDALITKWIIGSELKT